jgi:exodeoxyribonuclease-3
MRIATWNVNSIKQRVDSAVAWLKERAPDIVCLQETKCVDDAFPREPFEALGYNVAVHGQKTFNGVAILSKLPFDEVTPRLPGDHEDDHARFIEAQVSTGGRAVRVASIYLPNGNPSGTDKFTYKLGWMDRLNAHAELLLRREMPFVLAGDYNICPTDDDVYDPVAFRDDALCRLEARARFRALLYLGLTDAYRVFHREAHRYTFWDYQAGRWHRDEGLRIDHLLLSPHAADRIAACNIDKKPRAKDRSSDHTPIWCELAV